MLMSALVDPSAFDERHFQDKHYGSWARQFFKEMTTENGLFLADRNKRLLVQELRQRFHALSEKHRQQLLLCLAEAIKQKRFHFGDCSDVDMLNICCELIDQYNPDAVITSPENINRFRNLEANVNSTAVFSFHEYQDSYFQETRRRYIHEYQDLATMTNQEREDVFFRITRFSTCLRIYDKQIGLCDNEKCLNNFQKGIEFVLDYWPHCKNKRKGYLEIFTCARSKKHTLILNGFLQSLKTKYGNVQFCLFVKRDKSRFMHARYLQTQSAILNVDRGFDLYDTKGNFKLNPISLVMGQKIVDTLQLFRRLGDYIAPLT